MVSHRGGALQRAAIFEIGCNTGRAKRVVADRRRDLGRTRPAGIATNRSSLFSIQTVRKLADGRG